MEMFGRSVALPAILVAMALIVAVLVRTPDFEVDELQYLTWSDLAPPVS